MAAEIIATEVRWRRAGSNQAWRTKRFPPTASAIEIDELDRGTSYEGQARNLGPRDLSSAWVAVDFVVATASNTPLQPINLTASSVSDGIALSWSISDRQKPDVEYAIERASSAAGPWTEVQQVRSLQWTDPVLDDVENWYRVRALSFAGVPSVYSDIVSEKGYRDWTNLVRKGRFEDGRVGSWSAGAFVEPRPLGPWSNILHCDASSYENTGWFDAREGEKYTLSARCNANFGGGTLRLHTVDNADVATGYLVAATASATGAISGDVIIPANTVRARAAVFVDTGWVGMADIRCVKADDVRVAGSGRIIGDQRNLPQSIVNAYGSVRTAQALSVTSGGVVDVNAYTVRMGGSEVSYSAVTNAVTGLVYPNTYAIYCLDPDYTGGVKTWFSASSRKAAMNLGDGVVIAGEVTVPQNGSGGGGGGGAGFPDCVLADMILACGRRAGDIKAGDWIQCWNGDPEHPAVEWVQVESNHLALAPCHQITTASAEVTASDSTPMTLRDGRMACLPDMAGEYALVQAYGLRWEPVLSCIPAGEQIVAHIRVKQRCYFAGLSAQATIATHNPIYKP